MWRLSEGVQTRPRRREKVCKALILFWIVSLIVPCTQLFALGLQYMQNVSVRWAADGELPNECPKCYEVSLRGIRTNVHCNWKCLNIWVFSD